MVGWETYLNKNKSRFLEELFDFLRIPSVSSLPEQTGEVLRAAEWVSDRLKAAGVEEVRILPTGGHPIVYGQWLHAPGKPTIMIYGHFDVQPTDPLAEWIDPPFEPVIRQGRVWARGASDDKGNLLAPIIAVEAMLKEEGGLPVNLKFFFEGQEEIGSPQLPEFVEAHKELLTCDMAFSADGGQWREDQPALLLGFKGIAGLQVDVRGPEHDLHSGIYGGAVQNPIHALVRLIDSLHDSEGRILAEGFYETVRPLSQADRDQIGAIDHDEAEYKERLGVEELFGEVGYTTLERAWARPTLEVNGIWGGFQGEGIKTVIPAEAHAKITCRLVADQEPADIVGLISAHLKKNAPPGVRVKINPSQSQAQPYIMPIDHPGNLAAYAVLEELYGKPPRYIRVGGSIPVVGLFLEKLGVYTISFAFGLEDENVHAPNEFFRLKNFEMAQRAYVKLLTRIGRG